MLKFLINLLLSLSGGIFVGTDGPDANNSDNSVKPSKVSADYSSKSKADSITVAQSPIVIFKFINNPVEQQTEKKTGEGKAGVKLNGILQKITATPAANKEKQQNKPQKSS